MNPTLEDAGFIGLNIFAWAFGGLVVAKTFGCGLVVGLLLYFCLSLATVLLLRVQEES